MELVDTQISFGTLKRNIVTGKVGRKCKNSDVSNGDFLEVGVMSLPSHDV
jgi:hypothetical protein